MKIKENALNVHCHNLAVPLWIIAGSCFVMLCLQLLPIVVLLLGSL